MILHTYRKGFSLQDPNERVHRRARGNTASIPEVQYYTCVHMLTWMITFLGTPEVVNGALFVVP